MYKSLNRDRNDQIINDINKEHPDELKKNEQHLGNIITSKKYRSRRLYWKRETKFDIENGLSPPRLFLFPGMVLTGKSTLVHFLKDQITPEDIDPKDDKIKILSTN